MANIVTNTTSVSGMNQYYGVGHATLNAYNIDTFSAEDITMVNSTGEGVISGVFPNSHARSGETGWLTSRSIVKTFDLICEGEIEGIVSGEFVPDSSTIVEGQLGWNGGTMEPYTNKWPECFLRSVYLNDTPVVNADNLYNFQKLEIALANGTPSGIVTGDKFLYNGVDTPLERTRTINERLRGPDVTIGTGIGGNVVIEEDTNVDNPFYYHPKVYRFLNPEVSKLRANIKIPTLSYTKVGEEFETSEVGEQVGTRIWINYRYRPIYRDAAGNHDFSINRQWYGEGGDTSDGNPIKTKIAGLIKSAYLHSTTIELDQDLHNENLVGWELQVTRSTLDSITSHVVNQSFVDSITEIYNNTLSYPNSAVASMNFNAEYFSQIPNRAYDMRLLKVKVPITYEPMSHSYQNNNDGTPVTWNGTFKSEKQWTDNPAWIFYDLLTNERYGIGKHLANKAEVDKWTLYEIGRYCDALVSNGSGGWEPRFTCNVLINTREDAFKVLRDFASCFRSMLYYGFGNIQTIMDKPRSAIAQFNNSNVLDGNFKYASSSKKVVPTVCMVRYNDKLNFYKPTIEYVENTEGIRKYGIREKELTAFACTSRSQAIRLGRWILSTEESQTETISFTAGTEAMLLKPGDLIKVTDANRATGIAPIGGRAIQVNATGITLDRTISLDSAKNYNLLLTTPTYFYDLSLVSGLDSSHFADFRRSYVQEYKFSPGDSNLVIDQSGLNPSGKLNNVYVDQMAGYGISGTRISLGGGSNMFSNTDGQIQKDSTWSIVEDNAYTTNSWGIIGIKEEEGFDFTVEALYHNEEKYKFIESGVHYSYVPSPGNIADAPPAPTSVLLSSDWHNGSNFTKHIKIAVTKPTSIGTTVGYRIYIRSIRDWITASDMEGGAGVVPKEEYLFKTIFVSDFPDSSPDVWTNYIPTHNETNYYVIVIAVNNISMISSAVDGKDANDNEYIYIDDHHPVKDIKIHSLRISSNFSLNNVIADEPDKEVYSTHSDKDCHVSWDATFLNEASINLPIHYKVSIHEPNTGSDNPVGASLKNFYTSTTSFNFSFDNNRLLNGGPRRHFDLVVSAEDQAGIASSGTYNNSEFGYDIIEVLNPKPTGYYLTPRIGEGALEGPQKACDDLWTKQWIDSDGFVHLQLLQNKFTDLAGGFLYISNHPFSGLDFKANGQPKTIDERPHIVFGDAELWKKPEYEIVETEFQAINNGTFHSYDSEIVVKPDFTGNLNPPYYVGVKFYDSFDKEIKNQAVQVDNEWRSGILNNDHPNALPHGSVSGLYLGLTRDNELNNELTTTDYCFTTGTCIPGLADPNVGTPKCGSHRFSTKIWPTQFYSANQGGFKYWIRLNVNGSWEGQGVSHVKLLTMKDVKDLYDYKGFFEYSCKLKELPVTYYGHVLRYPNSVLSTSVCRFGQGHNQGGGNIGTPLGQGVYYGGSLQSMTTGATRLYPALEDHLSSTNDQLPRELSRAGIAYSYWTSESANFNAASEPSLDKIASYNERGQELTGTKYRSRPLRGFRRYRVYFDPKNLPQPSDPNGLSSYTVIGMNAWNGPYESWIDGNYGEGEGPENSILFAKDGTNVFTLSTKSWLDDGDIFENIPGVWNHHPAGFGQGFGGLIKTQKYFDVHLGRLIDDSYLNEAFFGVATTNDYGISKQSTRLPDGFEPGSTTAGIHEAVYLKERYVTLSPLAGGGGGDGTDPYPD